MASNSSGLYIEADRNRFSGPFSITIGEADADDATVASNDVVRFKVGRSNETPLVDIGSNAATANGSTATAANPTVVSLEAADLTFPAGIYDCEVSIYDTSETAIKKAERGVFVLRESMGGTVGGA